MKFRTEWLLYHPESDTFSLVGIELEDKPNVRDYSVTVFWKIIGCTCGIAFYGRYADWAVGENMLIRMDGLLLTITDVRKVDEFLDFLEKYLSDCILIKEG